MNTVRHIGPKILLFSGAYFDYLAPEKSEFTIGDIARGLSLACRFGNQCSRHYSVAQHSVHVSELLPPEHQYAGLMHDAAEAFVGDVPRPLKKLLPDYQVIEASVEAAIFQRFGVPTPVPDVVKEADIVMLATEQRQIMRNRDDWDSTRGRKLAALKIPALMPEEARTLFLERYRVLAP